MEQLDTQQIKQQSDFMGLHKLYSGIPMLTLTNAFAALALCLIAYSTLGLDMVLDWSAVFLGILLITLFVWTIYNRKQQSNEITKTSPWVTYYLLSNALVSVSFSVAYAYLLLMTQTPLTPFVALLFVTQCASLMYLYSANQTASTFLGLIAVAPVATVFALSSVANGFFYASAIGIFAVVSFLIARASNRQQLETYKRSLECEYLSQLSAYNKKRLAQTTIEDSLTQIYNRRFYEMMLEKEIRRAKRANTSLSAAIIQIDCFKEYKEVYGQKASEKCIRSVAQILSNATSRGGEFVARFGENSFALLAPNVKTDEAIAFTSKMLSLVAQADIPHKATTDEHHKSVSVSVGIAEFAVGSIVDVKGLLEQASIALRTANTIGTSTIQVFAQNVISKDHPIAKAADNSDESSVFNNQAQLSVVGLSSYTGANGKTANSNEIESSESETGLESNLEVNSSATN